MSGWSALLYYTSTGMFVVLVCFLLVSFVTENLIVDSDV